MWPYAESNWRAEFEGRKLLGQGRRGPNKRVEELARIDRINTRQRGMVAMACGRHEKKPCSAYPCLERIGKWREKK